MRISDWSSDVCSSDLRDPLGVVTPAVQAAVVDRLAHLEHAGGGHPGLVIARLIVTGGRRFNQPQPLPQPGGYRLAVVYQIGIADPPELDRKSVVYGKSVSVRVDLGGRRIINKKNDKLYYRDLRTTKLKKQYITQIE